MGSKETGYICPECGGEDVKRVWFQGPGKLICEDCDWWFPGFGEEPIDFDGPEPIKP